MKVLNEKGFVICFPRGARGRFVAHILAKILNKDPTPINYTKYNSAHFNVKNGFVLSIKNLKSFKIDHSINVYNYVPIVISHFFPDEKFNSHPDLIDKSKIIINITEEDKREIIVNNLLKNYFHRIEMINEGIPLSDPAKEFFKWASAYCKIHNFELNMGLINDPIKRFNIINWALENHYFTIKCLPNEFYGVTLPDSDTVLNISYGKLFCKTNEKYDILLKLCEFLGKEYCMIAHSDYERYDLEKYNIFEKFCPWFLDELKGKINA